MEYCDCGFDGLTFVRPSLVKPQFAADCDLSNIVRKFIRTGEFPSFRERLNIGSDANYPASFADLQDRIAFAKSQFEMLSPEERESYNNSPEAWLEAQSEPPEEKPAEEKPAEEKPAEEKPVEEKPQE